ncbi:MAG: sigma-70 family RNA polymerase sigma factor [Defluviitaleaceae bacterium]|nr:sigma-70 family RNA polymerase sigma factor [Defluviitaleaceae bacterium]
MTDVTLLAQAKKNPPASEHAFEEILRKYQKLIYHIARRYFNNPEDAMDASQDAAIKIYNGLPRLTLPEDGTLKAWICTVTARVCLDTLRKQRPQTTELTEEVLNVNTPSAEDNAATNERVREILGAINDLPPDHRMVVILRDMQGLTYDELANVLNITVGTVKSRLSRARAGLKRATSEKSLG